MMCRTRTGHEAGEDYEQSHGLEQYSLPQERYRESQDWE